MNELLLPDKFVITTDKNYKPEPFTLCYFFNAEFLEPVESTKDIAKELILRYLNNHYNSLGLHTEFNSKLYKDYMALSSLSQRERDLIADAGMNYVGHVNGFCNFPIIYGNQIVSSNLRLPFIATLVTILSELNKFAKDNKAIIRNIVSVNLLLCLLTETLSQILNSHICERYLESAEINKVIYDYEFNCIRIIIRVKDTCYDVPVVLNITLYEDGFYYEHEIINEVINNLYTENRFRSKEIIKFNSNFD